LGLDEVSGLLQLQPHSLQLLLVDPPGDELLALPLLTRRQGRWTWRSESNRRHTDTHTHTHTQTHTHTDTHRVSHTQAHTHAHTHARTQTHTHTHTHTH